MSGQSTNNPGWFDVADLDGSNNFTPRDVIGNRNDSHNTNSLAGRIHLIAEHSHKPQMCYPDLANPITFTTAAGAWAYGAYVEIVPVNTITSDFDIHWVIISAISANDDFQMELATGLGASEVFAGCFSFSRNAAQSQEGSNAMMTIVIPANTRISARIACGAGGAKTCTAKIMYHTY